MGCLGVCIQRTPGAREHDHRWILNAWGGSSAIEKIGSQGRPVLCSFLVKKFGDDRGHAGQQIGTGEVWKSVGGCGNRVDHWTSDDALPFLRRIGRDRGVAAAASCPPIVCWTYHACHLAFLRDFLVLVLVFVTIPIRYHVTIPIRYLSSRHKRTVDSYSTPTL